VPEEVLRGRCLWSLGFRRTASTPHVAGGDAAHAPSTPLQPWVEMATAREPMEPVDELLNSWRVSSPRVVDSAWALAEEANQAANAAHE
jgi:hypothetical protein